MRDPGVCPSRRFSCQTLSSAPANNLFNPFLFWKTEGKKMSKRFSFASAELPPSDVFMFSFVTLSFFSKLSLAVA